jgi:hypothetical protein
VRVAFYALLLVNLLYMAWAEWIDVSAPPAPSSIATLPPLKLLSDLPPAGRQALASKASLDTSAAPVCVSVGPFDDSVITAKAATLLLAKGFSPRQRTAESPAVHRLWVYLDGFRSDATEMRVLHKLERAGIDDAESMPAAAGGLRVSLGLFLDNAKAADRVKAVRAMGFHPLVTDRVLPGTVYWLDLTLPGGSMPVPLKDVSDLQPGGGSSPISAQPCPAAQSAAAPAPQKSSPAAPRKEPPARVPKAAPSTATSSGVPNLPRCKPGGGGPVPCVPGEPKKTTDPSVL